MTAKQTSRKSHSREHDLSCNTEEHIRRRAYELYEQRRKVGALDDWLHAEAEILGTLKQQKIKAARKSEEQEKEKASEGLAEVKSKKQRRVSVLVRPSVLLSKTSSDPYSDRKLSQLL